MQQDALLAIVTDDEGDHLYDPSTLLQGHFGLVLKVLEVRKIITSIKHALSIVRYFEFHMLTVAGWMIIKMKVRWLIADWNNSNSLGQWDRVSHIEIFDGASFLLSFT
jgi:hypothetical protein